MSLKRRSGEGASANSPPPVDDEQQPVPRKKKRKEVQYEDENDQENTQIGDVNMPDQAEVGIVEKVSLSNFMCHTRLEVSLGSNVNFVIGRNGSGKSAILTGLIVGLGGNASNTSRGNSLKGFIKEGCTAANVVIHLRNRGSDAYKPEEYGKTIIVERRLTTDGAGSYKIKSSEGRVISTRKGELVEILDRFNIQIDNPVSILTQDTARSFLNTSNERDKYAFFLKATQLEQMSSDYQLTIEEQERTKEMLAKKKEIIPELYEQVKVHEEKYKDMEQLTKMESHVNELKKDLAWAWVAEKKVELDQSQEVEEKCKSKIPSYEKHLNDTMENEKQIQTLYVEKGDELNAYNEEVQVLFEEKTELHATYKAKRKAMAAAGEAVKRTQRDIQSMKNDRHCLVSKVEEIKQTVLRDQEQERHERELLLEKRKELRQQCEAQLASSKHHLQQIDMETKRTQEQKYKSMNDMQQAQHQVRAIREKITSLQASKKDSLSQFGKSTDAVLKAIETANKQGKFHRKPVGPLGACLKLKDPKWAKAVEQTIKGTMCAYACNDNHDMMILKEIFKQKNTSPPTIIVSKFTDSLFDTSHNRPSGFSPITTVLDVLDISNHLVANALIDQVGIESVLLIEDPKVAQQVMWQTKPRGSTMAITLAGHQIIGGRSSKYYPCKDGDVKYFRRDVAASLARAEQDLLEAQGREKEVQQMVKGIETELKRHRAEYDQTRKKCSKEQDQINSLSMEIKDLQSFEEEKLPDVDALQSEVEEIDERMAQFDLTLNEQNTKLAEKREDLEGSASVMKECDEKCQVAADKLEGLKEELTTYEQELIKLKGHKVHYKQKLAELQNIIGQAHKAYLKVVSEFEKTREQAAQYCEERDVRRGVKSLQSEIAKAQRRIDNEELKRGNVAEITQKYHAALQHYDKAKKEIENCQKFRKAIERSIKLRAKRFSDFQKFIVFRATQFFQMLLSQRGYTGKLKFDHANETLTVQVNVEKTQGTSTKDSKALSGGERSFSTICFIMALWEAMEAPFRCLDEFDVFMDMLNRKISMRMLMKIAKEQQTRQFILLTPQDMSSVVGTDSVRIFKLTDPERGQQTLPFTAAAN